MRSLICAASVLAVMAVASLAAGSAGASDDDEETPTIKTVMEKLHKGGKSPVNNLKAALKGDSPDWEARYRRRQKLVKKYGDALPKNDPPRGKKEAYEKLAKAYASSAKSLEEAAGKENLKGARDALKKIQGSCTACQQEPPADSMRRGGGAAVAGRIRGRHDFERGARDATSIDLSKGVAFHGERDPWHVGRGAEVWRDQPGAGDAGLPGSA